jgi:hypothetical protein
MTNLEAATVYRLRLTGVCGIMGALCLMVGDFLITPSLPGRVEDVIVIRAGISEPRIYTSGLLGAVGCFFYLFAAWHGDLAFRPAGAEVATSLLVVFAIMLVSIGIYHAIFISLNFGAKVAQAAGDQAVIDLVLALPDAYARLFLTLLVIPSAVIFTALSGYAILSGNSLYPRWFVLLSPFIMLMGYVLLVMIAAPLAPHLLSFSLFGNVYNLAILLFVVASTSLLWNWQLPTQHNAGNMEATLKS